MTALANLVAVMLAAIVLAHGLWWTLACALAVRWPRPCRPDAVLRTWRLAVVIPAHDEVRLVGRCLESVNAALAGVDAEVIVVADNCGDGTASEAGRHGATVVVRNEPTRRGKSYALDAAIARLCRQPVPPDAVVFIDADSEVRPGFFSAIVTQLDRGAGAVQAYYAPANGSANLVRLRRLAFMLVHWSRPLGYGRMGIGTGIKGNGMALRWDLVQHGVGGQGLVEDAAMTLSLAQRGVTVRFCPDAVVTGFMASRYAAAHTQDFRWEQGRLLLTPAALGTAVRAVLRGRFACAAAALEVASLPLTLLVLAAGLSLGTTMVASGPVWLAVAAGASLMAYVAVGLIAARAPLRDVAALVAVPRFVFHKARVFVAVLAGNRRTAWQRTVRD